VALIVIMGVLGCVARWTIEEIVERRDLARRPYATMAVNAVGSLIAGFVVFGSLHGVVSGTDGAGAAEAVTRSPALGAHLLTSASPWLLTGFCGGFTTYSSALAIPYLDWRGGRRSRGVILVVATLGLCLVGYWAGESAAQFFV
jgi:fluoride exporter